MNAARERIQRIGHGHFDPVSGDLSLDGRTVNLRPRTAALLGYLLDHGGRVVGKDELLQAVWADAIVTEDSLVQCVKEIRQALGPAGRDWIRTVPRQGYAFIGDATPLPERGAAQSKAAPITSRLQVLQRHWHAAGAGALAVLLIAAGAFAWNRWWAAPNGRTEPPLSIVVMPIVNATGNPAQGDAVDDLTEALTDSLARSAGTTVIASSSAFTFRGRLIDPRRVGSELHVRYVLEGSLRLDGKEPVLTMRLADAANAVQLWNQEFRPSGGASLRELVARRVAGTLGLHLFRSEVRSREADFAGDSTPGALLTQARAAVRRSWEGAPEARQLLESAVRADDADAEALAMLASSYFWDARFSPTRQRDLDTAEAAVARALALAPDNDKVRVAEGRVYSELGNLARSLAAYERAIAINPSSAAAHAGRGDALVMMGRAEEALAPIEYAMRISPYDPLFFVWQVYAGVAHLHLKHDAQALELFSVVAREHQFQPFFNLFLASALAHAGRIPEARAEMDKFLGWRPTVTLTSFRALEAATFPPAFMKQRQHLYDGLRLAGMPE